MNFTDEQVRDIVELKERTMAKLEKYQKEVLLLEKQLEILDSAAKQSSFAKASSLPPSSPSGGDGADTHGWDEGDGEYDGAEVQQQQQQRVPAAATTTTVTASPDHAHQPGGNPTMITRTGQDGAVIARAHVTPDQVSIILDESLELDEGMSPFKTFFVDRIIGEMQRKDDADDSVPDSMGIQHTVNKSGSNIREIVVTNYRHKERVKEIVNTAGWSLNKMLDNSAR